MRHLHHPKRKSWACSARYLLSILAVIFASTVPGQVLAQFETCNSDLEVFLRGPGTASDRIFVGDDIRVVTRLRAQGIVGGEYLSIPNFGFAGDCLPHPDGLTYENCISPGNSINYLGVFAVSDSCRNAAGEKIEFPSTQSSFIDFIPTNGPIIIPENGECEVFWEFEVTALKDKPSGEPTLTTFMHQATSFPLADEGITAQCDNGLPTSEDRQTALLISTCDIDVEKQICSPDLTGGCLLETDWHDADTAEDSLLLSKSGLAAYRAIITNTGSTDYVDNIVVTDERLLGPGQTIEIPGLDAGESVTIGGAGSTAVWRDECADKTSIINTLEAEGQCRAGIAPFFASDSDQAHADCSLYEPPSIVIEKATNGEDADVAPGPGITVGAPVTWSYVVTNTGGSTLTAVAVADSDLGAVTCPKSVLTADESMTCTANGTAVAGQYANLGTVVGTPPTGPTVSDDDPSHYFGVNASIDIEKATNGEDADTPTGPKIPVGDAVTWTYVVTNTSNV